MTLLWIAVLLLSVGLCILRINRLPLEIVRTALALCPFSTIDI